MAKNHVFVVWYSELRVPEIFYFWSMSFMNLDPTTPTYILSSKVAVIGRYRVKKDQKSGFWGTLNAEYRATKTILGRWAFEMGQNQPVCVKK